MPATRRRWVDRLRTVALDRPVVWSLPKAAATFFRTALRPVADDDIDQPGGAPRVGRARDPWLGLLTYPVPIVGRTGWTILLGPFLPGTLILATARGSARVTEGLEYLVSRTSGRLALAGALMLAILMGFTFNRSSLSR